jgi:hypothetical protein
VKRKRLPRRQVASEYSVCAPTGSMVGRSSRRARRGRGGVSRRPAVLISQKWLPTPFPFSTSGYSDSDSEQARPGAARQGSTRPPVGKPLPPHRLGATTGWPAAGRVIAIECPGLGQSPEALRRLLRGSVIVGRAPAFTPLINRRRPAGGFWNRPISSVRVPRSASLFILPASRRWIRLATLRWPRSSCLRTEEGFGVAQRRIRRLNWAGRLGSAASTGAVPPGPAGAALRSRPAALAIAASVRSWLRTLVGQLLVWAGARLLQYVEAGPSSGWVPIPAERVCSSWNGG